MSKKRHLVGYIYFRQTFLDKGILKALEKRFNVVRLPFTEEINYLKLKQKTKNCRVILNYSISDMQLFEFLELSKTMEELGKKVINSTHSFLYQEDKWMFYLKCLEHQIPTPKTFLIAREIRKDSRFAREFLEERPLVLKAVFSDRGTCVEKASNHKEFVKKLKLIKDKDPISPIIVQEFIPHTNKTYRITLIGYKVVQSVEKIGHAWKQTGHGEKEHFRTVKISRELKELCEKTSRILNMPICGLDLILHDEKWYILEANGCPGLSWIDKDFQRLTEKLAGYLGTLCREK